MKSTKSVVALALFGAGLLVHCGDDDGEATPRVGASEAGSPDAGEIDSGPAQPREIPNVLSAYGLFTGPPDAKGHLVPVAGTVPYELTTALFSDYASKARTITIPPGKSAAYQAEATLDFPVGTIISKSFSFPADLRAPEVGVKIIETRILVRQPNGWEAYPYFWNAEQTEATLVPGGRVVPVTLLDLAGASRTFDYLVPSRNQCQQCHHLVDDKGTQVMFPIGTKARYLNRNHLLEGTEQNQLRYLASKGQLTGLPDDAPAAPNAFDTSAGTIEQRARTYLDINCAHCHNVRGTAGATSRLFLEHTMTDAFSLGVCKRPGSAGSDQGGDYDIVPGDSAHSILWNRVHTVESGKMMPQIGRTLRHEEGAQLIADWIDAMPPSECR